MGKGFSSSFVDKIILLYYIDLLIYFPQEELDSKRLSDSFAHMESAMVRPERPYSPGSYPCVIARLLHMQYVTVAHNERRTSRHSASDPGPACLHGTCRVLHTQS